MLNCWARGWNTPRTGHHSTQAIQSHTHVHGISDKSNGVYLLHCNCNFQGQVAHGRNYTNNLIWHNLKGRPVETGHRPRLDQISIRNQFAFPLSYISIHLKSVYFSAIFFTHRARRKTNKQKSQMCGKLCEQQRFPGLKIFLSLFADWIMTEAAIC